MVNEKHYDTKALASLWNLSQKTIRSLVKNEPGVVKLEGLGAAVGKRPYTTYSIPESVAARVYARLSNNPLKTETARRKPRSVVALSHLNGRVA